MSNQTETKRTNRYSIPALLARKFLTDYQESASGFPEDKQIEFLEHLLECLNSVEIYTANPTNENWKKYTDKENLFLKTHGNRLKMYSDKRMHLYYDDNIVLVEKGIYSNQEWNDLSGEEQKLSSEEFLSFIGFCKNSLNLELNLLLVEQPPEDEKEEKKTLDILKGVFTSKSKKGKLKREAQDKVTSLTQEQTVLLLSLLQQERVFLKDEYLNHKEAGQAFEMLTGYSQHTIRQNLSNAKDFQNKTNLKELDNLFTRLKIYIDKSLKEK